MVVRILGYCSHISWRLEAGGVDQSYHCYIQVIKKEVGAYPMSYAVRGMWCFDGRGFRHKTKAAGCGPRARSTAKAKVAKTAKQSCEYIPSEIPMLGGGSWGSYGTPTSFMTVTAQAAGIRLPYWDNWDNGGSGVLPLRLPLRWPLPHVSAE